MGSFLIDIIIQQLNQYIFSVEGSSDDSLEKPVVLGNMAQTKLAGNVGSDLEDHVVVSLVNIAEESTLKNQIAFRHVNGQQQELQPPVHINLYLLFAANITKYSTAINYTLRIIEFFQSNKIFSFKHSSALPASAGMGLDLESKYGDIELAMELHTLSFEQLNDLWGSLGGKQVPFVLYRARLIPIQMELPQDRSGLITDIELATQLKV